jgi:hypothetical protein
VSLCRMSMLLAEIDGVLQRVGTDCNQLFCCMHQLGSQELCYLHTADQPEDC